MKKLYAFSPTPSIGGSRFNNSGTLKHIAMKIRLIHNSTKIFLFTPLFTLLVFGMNSSIFGQTNLISATDGGFESGYAGWTLINNGTTAPTWLVNTGAGVHGGTNAIFIGTSPNTNIYTTSSAGYKHFYRDVAIPAGTTNITLQFWLKMTTRDNGYDYIDVNYATTAQTPVLNTAAPGTNIYSNTATPYSSYTQITATIPNSLAGTTVRLIFTYRHDGATPYANPAIDDIILNAIVPGGSVTTTYSYTGSTQTFTVPNCVTSLTVEAWGGGGRGSTRSTDGAGVGGGGGAYSKKVLTGLLNPSYDYYVGAGSATTTAGQDSYFGTTSTVLAKGGLSAADNSNNRVGGQAGSIGDVGYVYSGGNSAAGTTSSPRYGGGGGSSGGTSADGNYTNNTTTSQTGGSVTGGGSGGNGGNQDEIGLPGQVPGGGGGGAQRRNSNSTLAGGAGGNGQIKISYTLPNNPTITPGSNPTVCSGTTTADLSYSGETGCPDKYSIDYDAAANAAGFIDVTNATLIGSPITLVVPSGAAATTYNGTLTVINSSYGYVSTGMAITVTVNPLPGTPTASDNSKTYTGIANATSISAIPGTNETIDWYVASLGGTALIAGSNFYTPTSPIDANTYTYYAEARNTITGCVSASRIAVTLTINKATPTATLAVNNSPLAYDGTAKSATVGISASSVGGSVVNILTGGAASQTNVGTYAVIADFVPNDVTNYNTLTGLSAGNFVITPATSTTWTGALNSSWIDAGNWSPVLPDYGISVSIPNVTNKPIISSTGNECAGLSLVSNSVLTIAHNGNLTVTGALNNAGTETDLVIKSTSAGTGSLITKGTVTGTTTIERYIGGASWAWHFLSSPVASQAISPEFVALPIGTSEDFYSWSEPDQLWVNFKNATVAPTWNTVNGSLNFIPGRGYLVAYETAGLTKSFKGALNNGPVSYALTNGGTGANQYFNLVGNPYPCSIDWEATSGWGMGNLDGTEKSFWIWNDAKGNYGTYITNSPTGGTNDVTQYIASGQGFIVKAASAGAFTMNDDVKVQNAQPFLKSVKNSNEQLRLKLNCNVNTYSDEAIVAFNSSIADAGAQKFSSMYPEAPELWSVKNGNKYSINFMGDISSADIVPLSVKAGAAGTYTLTASQVESFNGNSAISLEDRATGTYTYLGATPSYTFQVSAPATITGRFFLHFMDVTGVANPDIARNFNMYSADGMLNIQSLQQLGGKVAVLDMLGRTIATGRVEAGATTRIDMHGNTGVYIVSVHTGKGISNTKVLVK